MKPSSEILRAAALLVERDRFDEYGCTTTGCNAIAMVLHRGPAWRRGDFNIPEDVMRHFRLVGPKTRHAWSTWWPTTTEAGRNARVVGLCLAAAIAETHEIGDENGA